MADEPTAVAIREGRAGKPGLICAADTAYFVYLFRGEAEKGRTLWRRRLDQMATAVAMMGTGDDLRLLVGTGNGAVLMLDRSGECLGEIGPRCPTPVVFLAMLPNGRVLLVAHRNGAVRAQRLGHAGARDE